MTRSHTAYTLLLYALLPHALLRLAWQARRQPAYLEHVAERFGRYDLAAAQPLIWVHAVSVGETRAAEPLIAALRARYPRHRILLSHMTPTGRETGAALFGDGVLRCYLPYDLPFAVERFLAHFRPACGILLETEIWPNLIDACHRRNIPLYLVNARMSEKSLRGYRRFGRLIEQSLQQLRGIAAQTGDDADRLAALGAVGAQVAGNLKFDSTPDPAQLALGARWRAAYGTRPVLLAASTRDGEEALLLDALLATDIPGVLLVIVPRHPQRFDEVASLLERNRIAYQRRSAGLAVAADTRVVLGDSMGEMFAYYAACDVAIIGGSFLPFGGQNLIEACALARPVIVGPHTYNFAEATQLALDAGAAVRMPDASGAIGAARELLRDRNRATAMGESGRAFAVSHQGATARIIAMLETAHLAP